MKINTIGRLIVISGMFFLFTSIGGRVAQATTISEVQNSIDTEYAAGNMGTDTYRDVSLAVSNIKFENNVYDKEAFTIIVSAYAGDKIQTDAANRILTVADGL